ncbi:hypothetical protein A2U01_0047008, partial [Trifolium medium]|nr:hypothetical protein [Trifolium medium]
FLRLLGFVVGFFCDGSGVKSPSGGRYVTVVVVVVAWCLGRMLSGMYQCMVVVVETDITRIVVAAVATDLSWRC